jgi:hypothetical protein
MFGLPGRDLPVLSSPVAPLSYGEELRGALPTSGPGLHGHRGIRRVSPCPCSETQALAWLVLHMSAL